MTAAEAGRTGLLIGGADVDAAAALLEGVVRHTPLEHSRALAERVGGPV